MAEGFTSPTSNILCRYFVHGACRLGDNCRFSHNRENSMSSVCKFYLQGCCVYGEKCRYDHIRPKSNNNKPSSQHVSNGSLKSPLVLPGNDGGTSNMVSLKKALRGDVTSPFSNVTKAPEDWVKATEFIPGQPYQCATIPSSYANAAHSGVEGEPDKIIEPVITFSGQLLCPFSANKECPYGHECEYLYVPSSYANAAHSGVEGAQDKTMEPVITSSRQLLCPYSANKECPYGHECEYLHGEICELCGCAVLVPGDENQQETHKRECLAQHERDMELSFAIARSQDKQCSICMDIVYEKEPPTERRFGIMSDCIHCFCLACIRKWRSSKQFDNKTIRSCPECRVQSDFVTPSKYWVDTKDEKIKLIEGYKSALSQKKCKYFDEGRGECPFNDKCFYLHAYPDGRKASPKPRKRRRRQNAEGHLDLMDSIFLWDFLQEREDRVQSLLLLELLEDDLTNLIFNLSLSSSDDSDSDDGFW